MEIESVCFRQESRATLLNEVNPVSGTEVEPGSGTEAEPVSETPCFLTENEAKENA